jgi:hypothetical protein
VELPHSSLPLDQDLFNNKLRKQKKTSILLVTAALSASFATHMGFNLTLDIIMTKEFSISAKICIESRL